MTKGQNHETGRCAASLCADLRRLLPLWPAAMDLSTSRSRLRLLAELRGVLRAERRRGIAGHWSYDLPRHRQLLAVYRQLARLQLEHPDRQP